MRPLHLLLLALVLLSTSTAEARKHREPLTRVHAIGGGYNFHWLTTDVTGGMRFHGPAVGYSYDVGRTVRFMIHAKAFFPIAGKMDNDTAGSYNGSFRSDYTKKWGVDGTIAVGRQFVSDGLVLILGGGIHLMGVRINSVEYMPVETITMGAGGLVRLRWGLGEKDLVQIGIDGQIGADFLSLLRQDNPVNLLVTGSALGTFGFKF